MSANDIHNQHAEGTRMIGAEALLRSLEAEGVDTVFGYPGGQILTVYDRLYDHSDKINHILARHEQGAIHAAEGYARITNRPGVVIVTSGPGVANVVTGLSDAQMDSTPLVVISGQVTSKLLGSDAFQETDVVGITLPVTKWSMQVRNPEDIPDAVAKAFFIASSGRPGPVVLDISRDAQVGELDWQYAPLKFMRSYDPRPVVKMDKLTEVASLINNSRRPLILAGHGIMISGAEEELRLLAERADIPVATTLLGLSTLPSSHPLNKGMLGMHGNIGPNFLTNKADLIIGIGMRFDDRVTADVERYAPDAKIIHFDIDKSEFNRNVVADVHVHADAKDALTELLPLIEMNSHKEWIAEFDACYKVENERVIKRQLHHDGPLTMGEVIDCVARLAPADAIKVTDVGQNQMMTARYSRYEAPRSIVTSGGLGTMGFGLPAAIGAKVGAPHRTVCLFCGDGGIQMTIEELGTIMQYGIDVKVIILNNSFLGNVRQWQELFYNHRYSQTPMLNPDFIALAAAYRIAGENVDSREELEGAVKRMLDHDGAYILNVNIEAEANVFPMITPGSSVDYIMLDPTTPFQP